MNSCFWFLIFCSSCVRPGLVSFLAHFFTVDKTLQQNVDCGGIIVFKCCHFWHQISNMDGILLLFCCMSLPSMQSEEKYTFTPTKTKSLCFYLDWCDLMQNQPILETTDWNMETLAKFLPEAVSLSIIIGKWMDECNCFLEENFNFACVSSYFAHHVWDLGYFHF